MDKLLPKIPHIVTAAESWNDQPYEARTLALARAAAQGLLGTSIDTRQSSEIKFSIVDFWDDSKRSMTNMPTIGESIEESRQHPEKYSRIIRTKPTSLLSASYSDKSPVRINSPDKLQMTEAEALENLADFMDQCTDVANSSGKKNVRRLVDSLREKTGYLSEANTELAADALANAWLSYVEISSNNIINVFTNLRQDVKKSEHFVLELVRSKLGKLLDEKPELAERIIFDSAKWQDATGAKLVVLDDWVMSGSTISGALNRAKDEALSFGHDSLVAKREVHLFGALGSSLVNQPDGAKLRSVYLAPGDEGPHSYSMTGWHSTADYGYESAIGNILSVLGEDGERIQHPFLYRIDRHYAPEILPEVLSEIDLERVATLKKRIHDIPGRFGRIKIAEDKYYNRPQSTRSRESVVREEQKRSMFLALKKRLWQKEEELRGELSGIARETAEKSEKIKQARRKASR
jgi:hypothetical protein